MKTTVLDYDFFYAFKTWQGGQYKDNFSFEGLEALYDYLIEYEDSTETEIELDVIALCCDYTEYETLKELQKDYDNIKSMEDLEDHTTVIPVGKEGIIIQNY